MKAISLLLTVAAANRRTKREEFRLIESEKYSEYYAGGHSNSYIYGQQYSQKTSLSAVDCTSGDYNNGACWLMWSGWSACEGVCGQHLQTAIRRCKGGIADVSDGCAGSELRRQKCPMKNSIKGDNQETICPYWTLWMNWQQCVTPPAKHYCDTRDPNERSFRRRYRTCADPTITKTYKGDATRCLNLNQGAEYEEEPCNAIRPIMEAPTPLYNTVGDWSKCDVECGTGTQFLRSKHVCADWPNTWVPRDEWYKQASRSCVVPCCRVEKWSDWIQTSGDICAETHTYTRTRKLINIEGGCALAPYNTMETVEIKTVSAPLQPPCSFTDWDVSESWGPCMKQTYTRNNGETIQTTCGVNGIQTRTCRHVCFDKNTKYRTPEFSPTESRKCGMEAVRRVDKVCDPNGCSPPSCRQYSECHGIVLESAMIDCENVPSPVCNTRVIPSPPAVCQCGDSVTRGSVDVCTGQAETKACPQIAPQCSMSGWMLTKETQLLVSRNQCICKNDLKHREYQEETCVGQAEVHTMVGNWNTPPHCGVVSQKIADYRLHASATDNCWERLRCDACPSCYDDNLPNHKPWSVPKVCYRRDLCNPSYGAGQYVSTEICPKPAEPCCKLTGQWRVSRECENTSGMICPSEQTVFEKVMELDYVCNGIIDNKRYDELRRMNPNLPARIQTEQCPRVNCPQIRDWDVTNWSVCSGIRPNGRPDGSMLHCGGYRTKTLEYPCPDDQCVNLYRIKLTNALGRFIRTTNDVYDTKYHSSYCYQKHLADNGGYSEWTSWATSVENDGICERGLDGEETVTYTRRYTHTRSKYNLCMPASNQVKIYNRTESYKTETLTCTPQMECDYTNECLPKARFIYTGCGACSGRLNWVLEREDTTGKYCPPRDRPGPAQCTGVCVPSAENPCVGVETCIRRNVCNPNIKTTENRACVINNYYVEGQWMPENNQLISNAVQRTITYERRTYDVECNPCGGKLVKWNQKCVDNKVHSYLAGTYDCPKPVKRWGDWQRQQCKPCRDSFDVKCVETRFEQTALEARHCFQLEKEVREIPLPVCTELRCCDPRPYGKNNVELTLRECGSVQNSETIPSEFMYCEHEGDNRATCGEGYEWRLEKQCSYNVLEQRFYRPGEAAFQIIPSRQMSNKKCQLHSQIRTTRMVEQECDLQTCLVKQRVEIEKKICETRTGAPPRWPFNQVPPGMTERFATPCPIPTPPAFVEIPAVNDCRGRCGIYETRRVCMAGDVEHPAVQFFANDYNNCACGMCCRSDGGPNVRVEGSYEITTHQCPTIPNTIRLIQDPSCECGTCMDKQCEYDGCTQQEIRCVDVPRNVPTKAPTVDLTACIYPIDKCAGSPYRIQSTTTYCDLSSKKLYSPPNVQREYIYNDPQCQAFAYTEKTKVSPCDETNPCKPFRIQTTELHCEGNSPSFINVTSQEKLLDCYVSDETYWTEFDACTVKCGVGKQYSYEIRKCDGQRLPLCRENNWFGSSGRKYCSTPRERNCGCPVRRVVEQATEKQCDRCGPATQQYTINRFCVTEEGTDFTNMQQLADCSACSECNGNVLQPYTVPFQRDDVCPMREGLTETRNPPACPKYSCNGNVYQTIKKYDACGREVDSKDILCPNEIPGPEEIGRSQCSVNCGEGTMSITYRHVCKGQYIEKYPCKGQYGDVVERRTIISECKECSAKLYVERIDSVCSLDSSKFPDRSANVPVSRTIERECKSSSCIYWGSWSSWGACSTSCSTDKLPGIRVKQRFCNGGDPGQGNCFPAKDSTMSGPCPNQRPCCDFEWSSWSEECCNAPGKSGPQQKRIKVNRCGAETIVKEELKGCVKQVIGYPKQCSDIFSHQRTTVTTLYTRITTSYTYTYGQYKYSFTRLNGNGELSVTRCDTVYSSACVALTSRDFEEFYDTSDNNYYYRLRINGVDTWFSMDGNSFGFYEISHSPVGWTAPRSWSYYSKKEISYYPVAGSYVGQEQMTGSFTIDGTEFVFEKNPSGNSITWFKMVNGKPEITEVKRKVYQNTYYYQFGSDSWWQYNGAIKSMTGVTDSMLLSILRQ
jgi:hypothetical protein